MRIIGLTGVIGAGKTTTAALFAAHGFPVHDADACVHALYDGEAVPLVEAAFPGTTSAGKVDRTKLAAAVVSDETAMKRLEEIVHPLVTAHKNEFIAIAKQNNVRAVILDVPLLFETGGDRSVDVIIVATANAETLKNRVFDRPDMTVDKYAALSARQMPDAQKRARAHFLVDTGRGLETAGRQVEAIIRALAAAN
ncbi:MAG: dephospho-CoA kinase [Alphaproteobacteria bacterium]